MNINLFARIAFALTATCGAQPTTRQDRDGQESVAPITSVEFDRLHLELEPQGETWKSIPWQSNLIDAQHQAAKQGKLIFIWAMDGHPLGCT